MLPHTADVEVSSRIGATALREDNSSGFGRTKYLCHTDPVPTGPFTHSAGPAPFSFLTPFWKKPKDQAAVRRISAEDIVKRLQDDIADRRTRELAAVEREYENKTLWTQRASVAASIGCAKVCLHDHETEAARTQ